MNELKVAYIRPKGRSTKASLIAVVSAYPFDRMIVEGEDGTAEDAVRFMTRRGRTLIVPHLRDLDRKRTTVAQMVEKVLSHGCTIIEARKGRVIAPECLDAVMAGLDAPRHDIARAKVKRSASAGGSVGYPVDQLEACKPLWESTRPGREIAKECGISYATLYRYFRKTRAVPVKRGRGAGRR